MRVAGLGQCSLDFIAFADKYPAEDSKKEVFDSTIEGGGPAATALVALSRLNVKTFFIGVVSDDLAGKEIKEGLEREGVDTRSLLVRPGGESQKAFIIVNRKTGARNIFWQRPTVERLKPKDAPEKLIKKSDLLLLDGLMLEASLKAANIARENNVPVMLDAGGLRPGMLRLAGLSDYIVASRDFALAVAKTPEDALKRLGRLKPRAVTITLGAEGSITQSGGKTFRTRAFRVRAVDTTGAGDVFHGGYVYGLLRGWDMEKTVEFASAFAALKCLKPGGRAGIPALSKTLDFIKGGR